MLDYEMRYVMIELYCLTLVWGYSQIETLHDRVFSALDIPFRSFEIFVWQARFSRRLMRWLVLLTEFDIHYVTQKSIKRNIVVDHLASLPVSDGRAIDDNFPYEDVAVMTSLSGWRISVHLAFSDRHPATNNIVEYEACILGLETTLELEIRQMEVLVTPICMGYRHYWGRFRRSLLVVMSSSGRHRLLHQVVYVQATDERAVEAANKNIKRILRMMIKTSWDWSEKLSFALWAYQTSFHTSTGATPYSLVYGMEIVLLVEIEMDLLRVALEQQILEFDLLHCLIVDIIFTLGTFSFPSFLLPYHPSLYYVPCLKTTMRPWDQMSSSTASTWTARRLEPSSLLSYDVQSRLSQFDIQRCQFSVMAFRATISLQLGVQSHHRFSVTMFKVVILSLTFRDSRISNFGVQSHYPFSVMAFRGFIFFSMAFRATSPTWGSEPPSLLSLGVQSHHFFSVWRSESLSLHSLTFRAIILSRSSIRCHLFGIQGYIPSVQGRRSQLSIQSHHIFSLAFRAISQLDIRCRHFPLV
ncbi:hypothetical protein CK203_095204 [Vitis vinifera]|uniref:Integrase catalytic domain-containing protein n=1 Tax=Vitis vinifera TaxID=29760 RepID=A0A438E131_VITVI|nr:hypothetical protein CK203_095204 [Vitis vinifera]